MKLLCPKCRRAITPDAVLHQTKPDAFICGQAHNPCWQGTAAQAVDAAVELTKSARESQDHWVKLAAWLEDRPGAFKPEPKPAEPGKLLEELGKAIASAPVPQWPADGSQRFNVIIQPLSTGAVRWGVFNPNGDTLHSGHSNTNNQAIDEIAGRMKSPATKAGPPAEQATPEPKPGRPESCNAIRIELSPLSLGEFQWFVRNWDGRLLGSDIAGDRTRATNAALDSAAKHMK